MTRGAPSLLFCQQFQQSATQVLVGRRRQKDTKFRYVCFMDKLPFHGMHQDTKVRSIRGTFASACLSKTAHQRQTHYAAFSHPHASFSEEHVVPLGSPCDYQPKANRLAAVSAVRGAIEPFQALQQRWQDQQWIGKQAGRGRASREPWSDNSQTSQSGLCLIKAIAGELNERAIAAPRGGKWHLTTVTQLRQGIRTRVSIRTTVV